MVSLQRRVRCAGAKTREGKENCPCTFLPPSNTLNHTPIPMIESTTAIAGARIDSSSRTARRSQRLQKRPQRLPLITILLLIGSSTSVRAHSVPTSFEASMKASRNPHQQMCSLLFQTPACTQPAVYRKPVVPRPGPGGACSQETCSLSGPSPVAAAPALPGVSQGPSSRRRVQPAAQLASSTTSTSTQQWWKKQSELWVDVHTEEQFYQEISTGNRIVFVGA